MTRALKEFYDYVTTDSSTVAVIGCGCTPVTEAIAKISWLWNVPVVSCIHLFSNVFLLFIDRFPVLAQL